MSSSGSICGYIIVFVVGEWIMIECVLVSGNDLISSIAKWRVCHKWWWWWCHVQSLSWHISLHQLQRRKQCKLVIFQPLTMVWPNWQMNFAMQWNRCAQNFEVMSIFNPQSHTNLPLLVGLTSTCKRWFSLVSRGWLVPTTTSHMGTSLPAWVMIFYT